MYQKTQGTKNPRYKKTQGTKNLRYQIPKVHTRQPKVPKTQGTNNPRYQKTQVTKKPKVQKNPRYKKPKLQKARGTRNPQNINLKYLSYPKPQTNTPSFGFKSHLCHENTEGVLDDLWQSDDDNLNDMFRMRAKTETLTLKYMKNLARASTKRCWIND